MITVSSTGETIHSVAEKACRMAICINETLYLKLNGVRMRVEPFKTQPHELVREYRSKFSQVAQENSQYIHG